MAYANWSTLGDEKFRETTFYSSMRWESVVAPLFGNNPTFAIGKYAGPIAIAQRASEDVKHFSILLYSASGTLTGKIEWTSSPLVHMTWTQDERLLCVPSDGRCVQYDMFGERTATFGMGTEAAETQIVSVTAFSSEVSGVGGIAVLTNLNRIFVVNNTTNPSVWRTPELNRKSAPPTCWTAYNTRATRIIYIIGVDIHVLAQGNAQLVVRCIRTSYKADSLIQKPASGSPIAEYRRVCVSPNGQRVALLGDRGQFQVFSIDFKQCLCDAAPGTTPAHPIKFTWCGPTSVAFLTDHRHRVDIFNVEGERLTYSYITPVVVQAECDGLRVLSANQHSFIEPVPDSVESVLQISSVAPGANLLFAYDGYVNGDLSTYPTLKTMEAQMDIGVQECIEAAANETDVESQKRLLSAASFGKAFAHNTSPEAFVTVSRMLRVLNACRQRHFALPLTYAQLDQLSLPSLIDRIIARRLWPLALSICKHMRIADDDGTNRVLAHWAFKKVGLNLGRSVLKTAALPTEQTMQMTSQASAEQSGRVHLSAEHMANVIVDKFAHFPSVSYADVAQKAAKLGLVDLATLLLDKEPQVRRQVRMLLQLERWPQALIKANDSQDPDLLYYVMITLRSASSANTRTDIDLLLRKVPQAYTLYKQFIRQHEPGKHLNALYKQDDDYGMQALGEIRAANQTGAFETKEKQDHMLRAQKLLLNGRQETLSAAAGEHVKLLDCQARLESEFGTDFIDKSLRDTVMWLLTANHNARAESIKKDFKIADRQYAMWKVSALASGQQWSELDVYAKSKKAPFGLLPFVEAAMANGNKQVAQRFIERMSTNSEEQIRARICVGDLQTAAQQAFETGNDGLLARVQSRAGGNAQLLEQIRTFQAQRR